MKEIESILGKNVQYIMAAMPEIERQKLNLELYRLTLIEDMNTVTVLLIDKNTPRGPHLGNPGKIPAYEVELNRDTGKLLKAHYVR